MSAPEPPLSEDTRSADAQTEAEGNSKARFRYQRLFWEPVVEGEVRFQVQYCRNNPLKCLVEPYHCQQARRIQEEEFQS